MGWMERRIATWVDLTGDLLTHRCGSFPQAVIADRLNATFGTQVSWNWLDPDGSAGFELHIPIPNWPPPELERDFDTALIHHPLIRWFAVADSMAAMSIGRVPRILLTAESQRVVAQYLAPIGMEEQLSIPYRLGSRHHRAFVLARSGGDFSDGELELARQLQPLFRLLDRQYAELARLPGEREDLSLTGRELAVLRLLADGLTASAMARRLEISPRTVHCHLAHIYQKLGVNDRLKAILIAREAGILSDALLSDRRTTGEADSGACEAPRMAPSGRAMDKDATTCASYR